MDLGELRVGERALWQGCQTGEMVDLTGQEDRVIRAKMIERLLTGPDDERPPAIRAIRLANASIDGELDISGVEVRYPVALERCDFEVKPDFQDARMINLSLAGSRLPGLNAEGLEIRGSVRMDEGFTSVGEVNLIGIRVGGSIYLRDARLERLPAEKYALNISRGRVEGHFSCTNVEVHGQLRMISAKIGGVLNLRNTKLLNAEEHCLQAERIEVGEGIWFGPAFIGEGNVLLNHAQVEGGVDLSGTTLLKPKVLDEPEYLAGRAVSLRAMRIRVGRGFICSRGFNAEGGIEIDSADIGGTLTFRDAVGSGPDHRINLAGTRVRTINLLFRNRPDGEINLRNARTIVLVDEARAWPTVMVLDGFVYERLQPKSEVSVSQRIEWIKRTPGGYFPQPYEQLISVYRAAGQEPEARHVALAKQRARHRSLRLPGKMWGMLLYATVGYGYRTWLAAIWLSALTLVGTVAFAWGHPLPASDKPPAFHAFVYTVDVLLPIVDLGQEHAWRFSGALQWLSWTYIVAGWLLTTAVLASIARVLNRS